MICLFSQNHQVVFGGGHILHIVALNTMHVETNDQTLGVDFGELLTSQPINHQKLPYFQNIVGRFFEVCVLNLKEVGFLSLLYSTFE
jgi:hypothetical protein